jgi:Glyoxalase/Bleomycin resistance protein/Dioxygenase superfamily
MPAIWRGMMLRWKGKQMIEGQFYQLGYICDSLEEGIAQLRGRGMTHEPHIIEIDQPVDSPHGEVINKLRLAFVWIGDVQYELIQPITDPLGIYANCRSNGGPLRFHQICMRISGTWEGFLERVKAQDLPLVMWRDMGGDNLKFAYIDARSTLGHYLEYTWMTAAAWDQIRGM